MIVLHALKEMGVCGLYLSGKNALLDEGCMLGWAPPIDSGIIGVDEEPIRITAEKPFLSMSRLYHVHSCVAIYSL